MRVVNSLDELLQLPRDRSVNGLHRRSPVQLAIPDLTRHALTGAQEALNSLQERGGTIAAATAMFIALIAGVIKVCVTNPSMLSTRAFAELAVVLGISFGIGALARVVALAVTRWQFGYRCRTQYRVLSMLLQDPN